MKTHALLALALLLAPTTSALAMADAPAANTAATAKKQPADAPPATLPQPGAPEKGAAGGCNSCSSGAGGCSSSCSTGACGCDDNCGCDCDDDCCDIGFTLCPCAYAFVEGLYWDRDNNSINQPLVLNLNTNQVLLTTHDLDFNWAGGVRTTVGFKLDPCCDCSCCCRAVEFTYFGIYDQEASATVALADQLRIPGDLGLAVNNFFFADVVNVDYRSELHNFEANFPCCCCCYNCDGTAGRSVEWFGGFRYVNFKERFSLLSIDFQESSTLYDIRTKNDLYGAQIGTRVRRQSGRWGFEATGKAGIFANDASQDTGALIDFPNFQVRPARSADETDVAFLGDVNFTVIYQLNSTWNLRTGYNLMWIDGVALAPDQLDFTNTATSGTQLTNNGSVFFHGVSAGLEARW